MPKQQLTELRAAIDRGRTVLFLGAGAATGCLNEHEMPFPTGGTLAKALAAEAGLIYDDEDLAVVYTSVGQIIGTKQLHDVLRSHLSCLSTSSSYRILASIPWGRIYTTNIDNGFEAAATLDRTSGRQELRVQTRNSPLIDRDETYQCVDLVKLHGTVERLGEGLVFGSNEFGAEAAKPSQWYTELGQDYYSFNFIIVGSRLREPLVYQQIERARAITGANAPRHYVIVPSLSTIERTALEAANMRHIPWTVEEFANWLSECYPSGLDYLEVATNNNPTIRRLLRGTRSQQEKRAAVLHNVVQIRTDKIERLHSGTIRDFYRGFKPDWGDIQNSVPAETQYVKGLLDATKTALSSDTQCLVVSGPAGSGKSTAARLVAYQVAKSGVPAFAVETTDNQVADAISELERASNQRFLIICDRLEHCANAIAQRMRSGDIRKAMVLGVESQHVWVDRLRGKFEQIKLVEYRIDTILRQDVDRILAKLEQWGPWTKLAQLNKRERHRVLFDRSRRQLLIGLLEATQGIGFEEIIKRDFSRLAADEHRELLTVVGLASIHRLPLPMNFAGRAMQCLGYDVDPRHLASAMDGVVHIAHGQISARHPTYVRALFEGNVSTRDLAKAIESLLTVFTAYDVPVVRSVSRSEYELFKRTVNNRFLRSILRETRDAIIGLYRSFEKPFEQDGLFWLQYGLALRHFGYQREAFEKLRTAVEAHPQTHTRHAFAQQQFIMALREPGTADAENWAQQARDTLETLWQQAALDDSYPIVALAKGHTAYTQATAGPVAARVLARTYANRIYKALKVSNEPVLRETWTWLTQYAVDGAWTPPDLAQET